MCAQCVDMQALAGILGHIELADTHCTMLYEGIAIEDSVGTDCVAGLDYQYT
jgi:hypothetical protein